VRKPAKDRGPGSAMTSAAYYRREAERARQSAVDSKEPDAILRWLKIAKDYRALADALETEERAPSVSVPPPVSGPQQQPVQQQQSKIEPNENEP
jgi:hypothetical protein